jgi:hypothetical protein
MITVVTSFEVEDFERWTKDWTYDTPGNVRDRLAGIATARTFRDPENPKLAGVLFDITDMGKLQAWFASDEATEAGQNATIKYDTLRTLSEFTP